MFLPTGLLDVLSGYLSVFAVRELLIEVRDSGGWGPVDVCLLKILTTAFGLNKHTQSAKKTSINSYLGT